MDITWDCHSRGLLPTWPGASFLSLSSLTCKMKGQTRWSLCPVSPNIPWTPRPVFQALCNADTRPLISLWPSLPSRHVYSLHTHLPFLPLPFTNDISVLPGFPSPHIHSHFFLFLFKSWLTCQDSAYTPSSLWSFLWLPPPMVSSLSSSHIHMVGYITHPTQCPLSVRSCARGLIETILTLKADSKSRKLLETEAQSS